MSLLGMPAHPAFAGRSMLPGEEKETPIFTMVHVPALRELAVIDGHFKLIMDGSTKREVYDLASDVHLKPLRLPWVIEDVDVSPDGRLVCTVGRHGDAIFWDVESGKEAFRVPKGPWIRSVAFSPDPRPG